MNGIIFLIFIALIIGKSINGWVIGSWIHRISYVNVKIINFLIGYLGQMALFGLILIISYFLNFTLQNLIYCLTLGQGLIIIIAIINFRYYQINLKINWKRFLTTIVAIIITFSGTILHLTLFNSYSDLEKNDLNNYPFHSTINETIQFLTTKQLVYWQVICVAFQDYLTNDLAFELLLRIKWLAWLEFNFLFCLLFTYVVQKKIITPKKPYNLTVLASFLGIWIISYLTIIQTTTLYWFIIYAAVMILITYRPIFTQVNHYLLAITLMTLSTFFYNQNSCFWILLVGLNNIIYFLIIKEKNLVFYLLSNLLNIFLSLIVFGCFQLENNNYPIFLGFMVILIALCLITILLIYCFNHKLWLKQFLTLDRFITSYLLKIVISFSLLLFLTYLFSLSFHDHWITWKTIKQLFYFHDYKSIISSIINITYLLIFTLIVSYYLHQKWLVKKPNHPISQTNYWSILIMNNPLIFCDQIFFINKITNVLSQKVTFVNPHDYFWPFLIFIIMNFLIEINFSKITRHFLTNNYHNAQRQRYSFNSKITEKTY